MLLHGVNHAQKLGGTGRWLARAGFRAPRFHAWVLSLVEIGAGVGLIVGLLTAPAAAATVGVMVVAFVTQHMRNGFFIFNKGQGYEYVGTLAVVGAGIALVGAGEWSIDAALGLQLEGSWSGAILIASAGLALLHVAAYWRPGKGR